MRVYSNTRDEPKHIDITVKGALADLHERGLGEGVGHRVILGGGGRMLQVGRLLVVVASPGGPPGRGRLLAGGGPWRSSG